LTDNGEKDRSDDSDLDSESDVKVKPAIKEEALPDHPKVSAPQQQLHLADHSHFGQSANVMYPSLQFFL
jgi:hypothetical protein